MKTRAEEDLLAFSPENKKGWTKRYEASINTKKSMEAVGGLTTSGELTCTSSIDDFERNRVKSVDDIKPVEGVATPFLDRLKAANTTKAVAAKNAIAEARQLDPGIREQLNKDFASLNQMMTENKKSPSYYAEYLIIRKGEAKKDFEAELELAKNNTNDLFSDSTFTDNLKSLDWSDDDIAAFKNELTAMDKADAEELAKVEKAIETNINQFFNAETNERRRINYLAAALARHREVAKEIEAMRQGDETAIVVGVWESDASLKNVDPKKLTKSESVAGDAAQKQEGTISFSTSRIWESDDSIRMRTASLVEQLLAEGHEYITLKVNNKDPKEAARVAKLVMEGAVAGGADPKKIILLSNNDEKWKYDDKDVLKDELFKDEPERKKFADFKKTDLAERQEKIMKGTPAERAEKARLMKEQIQAMQQPRAADEVQQQQPIQP